jgi:hypothetical protein
MIYAADQRDVFIPITDRLESTFGPGSTPARGATPETRKHGEVVFTNADTGGAARAPVSALNDRAVH